MSISSLEPLLSECDAAYFLCFEMPSGDRDLIPPAKIARFAKALMIGAESGAR
ncbi:MAG: hypothetical protein P8L39_00125 [Halioglobus sp.]|nr:hypothetical protein [Halioglobus sp.]